jgi:hypothetical protein
MITIAVETDEEEATVRGALESGALREAIGQPLRITRGWRTVGGSGSTNTVVYSGTPGAGGGGGYTGTCEVAGGNGGPSAAEIIENVRRMRGPLR